MIVISHPPYLPYLASCDCPLFPRLKIKLKGRHFDTVEVIEAESLVVLNTLTEHNFQDAFKKLQKHWDQYMHMETDLRVMVVSRSKVNF
jgi:hypothetical protein